MNLLVKENNTIENGEDLGHALIKMIGENLNIKQWNFHLAYTNFAKTSELVVIYDSEWCRINFMFSRQREPKYDELTVDYGRLHAPNNEPFMIWQGQECRCWHNVFDPLRFLDGLSPSDAMKQAKIDKQLPHIVTEFRHSELGKKLIDEYPPKSAIVLQSVLWKHYGNRLFELFDLRRPDLWAAYRSFIKEYYGLLGMKASYGPPYENVC